MHDVTRVLLIIPCYNEEGAIAGLLEEIALLSLKYDVVVIDDGSHDNTFHIASKYCPTVRLLRNLGIGGAVQTGIRYAMQHDYDCCVQIDGDGQHPPEEVTKLLAAYDASPRSIIIGSRYIDDDSFRSTWARRVGGQLIAGALNKMFLNCRISDPTSGMRLLDRQTIKLFSKHYPHDFPEPISLAWALRNGLTVAEVPVKMRAREHGKSSIIGFKPIAYMLRVLFYIALARVMYFKDK